MKPKRKLDKSGNSKSKKNIEVPIFVGTIIVYFIYMIGDDQILNYPKWIYYILFLLFWGLFSYLKIIKTFVRVPFNKDLVVLFFNVIKFAVFSWFLAGIVLIPFNFYNIYISKKNTLEAYECKITGISTYSQNRCVFFVLEGETNVIYLYKPIMEDLKNKKNYNEYKFIVDVRQGLLGSYVLEDWDIQKR